MGDAVLIGVEGKAILTEAAFVPPPVPPLVPGLVAWYDFSDPLTMYVDNFITPVAADNDVIFGVADKSGNGKNLIQSVAARRPLYKVNIQNGRSVARFDGTDDNMETTTSFAWSASHTIFVVSSRRTTAGHGQLFDGDAGAGPRVFQTRYDSGGDVVRQITWAGVVQSTAVCSPIDTKDVLIFRHLSNTVGGDRVYVNGVPGTAVNSGVGDTSTRKYYLGATGNGTLQFLPGDVGEVIVYSQAASVAQLNLVGSDLASRWGTTWTPVT